MIEFKVNELTDVDSVLVQIKACGCHEKFVDSGRYLIGINFSRENRNITDFAWEKTI